jgi:hypothetical protein
MSVLGFIANDNAESEIPYIPLIFPGTEPTSDVENGPNCGFTDFVDSGLEDPALFFLDDANNWLFRFRMGSAISNAKSYSVLIDTDNLFGNSGPYADPDYTANNPGFEIELVLATKFGVYVYDVDGIPNCEPVISYDGTTNYQKSIAHSEICGSANYFLDFYVLFDDLTAEFGVTPETPMRFAIIDNMAAKKSTVCNPNSASDIGGVDGSCGSLASCYELIIFNQAGCAPADINAGLCQPKTSCPSINAPINSGDTELSGFSEEEDGTIINVYKNGILIGETTVSGGAWILSGLDPLLLSEGDTIQSDALAEGKEISFDDCNVTFVSDLPCSETPISAAHCGKSIQGLAVEGALIKIYQGVSLTPSVPTSGTIFAGGEITATSVPSALSEPSDNFLWKCVGDGPSLLCNAAGPNCLIDGAYRITATEPGKCESSPLWICVGAVDPTGIPEILGEPILDTMTIVSGAVGSPDNIAGVNIFLYVNGIEAGTTLTAAGGIWSVSDLDLNPCDTLTAIALNSAASKCPSDYSNEVIVIAEPSSSPVVDAGLCVAEFLSDVSGTSAEGDGSLIQVYSDGVLVGSSVVLSGVWTVSGLSIPAGSEITATCEAVGGCSSVSGLSATVLVESSSVNLVDITTTPITEGETLVSGTGTDGDIITLFVDGILIEDLTATVSGGIWTISDIPAY